MNRLCSSGLQAVADVAAYIKAGFYDIGKGESGSCVSLDCLVLDVTFPFFVTGIGAGLECMTQDSISRIQKKNPKVHLTSISQNTLSKK